MRWTLAALVLAALAIPASGQEWPKPTEEGTKALEALVRRCIAAGGLKEVADAKSGNKTGWVVADPERLARAIMAERAMWSPALREALVARWHDMKGEQKSAVVAVLHLAGESTGDLRLQAFSVYFSALAQAATDPQGAVSSLRKSAEAFERVGDQLWQAACVSDAGLIRRREGKYLEALDQFRASLKIRRAVLGERHPDVAATRNNIATVLSDLGRHAEALEQHRAALTLQRAALGDLHPDVAASRNNIAVVLNDLGRHGEALDEHRAVLEIRRAALGDLHPDVAVSRNNIAVALSDLGRIEEALDEHRAALEIRRASLGDRHLDVGQSRENIAIALSDLGRPAEALEEHRAVLTIRRTALGDRHPEIAASRNNIAIVLNDLGRHVEALHEHRAALEIRRAALGAQHIDVAASLNNIAAVLSALGCHAEALEEFRKALKIWRAEVGDGHPDVGSTRHNIAVALNDLGRHGESLEEHRAALEILRASFGDRHPDVGQSRDNIAVALSDLGRPAAALEELDRAADALRGTEDPADPSVRSELLYELPPLPVAVSITFHRAAIRAADPNAGGPALTSALRDYQAVRRLLSQLLQRIQTAADSRLLFGEEYAELAQATVGVARRLARIQPDSNTLPAAFEAAEAGVARVFVEELAQSRSRKLGHLPADFANEEDRLNRELDRIDRVVDREQAKTLESRNAEMVARLLDERKRTEADLAALVSRIERDQPRYAALRYPKPCTLAEARACLADDEVALLYVLGTKTSYLIVLEKAADGKSGGLAVHELPPAATIGELGAALARPTGLENAEATRERGTRAYAMLLAPAAEAIRGKHLVVVPSGPLGHLPFELLVEPGADGTPRWLVEGHRIRYAPSMSALHLVRLWDTERARPERSFWALGDPVYQATDPRLARKAEPQHATAIQLSQLSGGERADEFKRLVFTGAEVERLRGLMGAASQDILVGPDATEATIKRLSAEDILARYRYLHFACHGMLGLASSTPPALVLSLPVEQKENGLLELDEVTRLKLNADLVVLSACQTGLGRTYNAEGVSGLARAFLYAGSKAVVCSLWRVDDEATSELMAAFYSGLKAGKPASEALRAAQLELIHHDEPPLHWAPFVLIGQD